MSHRSGRCAATPPITVASSKVVKLLRYEVSTASNNWRRNAARRVLEILRGS